MPGSLQRAPHWEDPDVNTQPLPAILMVAALFAAASMAQELKPHQFLPAQVNVPKLIVDVWADDVERDSGARIKIDRFPSAQLGSAAPELMDQVIDGVADVVWTAVGHPPPGASPRPRCFSCRLW